MRVLVSTGLVLILPLDPTLDRFLQIREKRPIAQQHKDFSR